MSATSANSRSIGTNGTRLPLTPKVTSNRRGSHTPSRRPQSRNEAAPVAATPAMHVTPNVVIAARGGVPLSRVSRLSAYDARALDMRGLRF